MQGLGFGESIAMQALLALDSPHAAELLDAWARTAPPLAHDPLAHVAPGVPLLELYTRTRDHVLLERALELAEVLASTSVGVHGARIHRPDLAGWEHEVWVDCMHLDGPFLAELANVSGDSRWRELAVDLLLSHARVQQDERTGLFARRFVALVDALARCESASGCWHTVVNDSSTYLEASVAAFVALGVGRAVDAGLLDPGAYAPLARRAFEATCAAIDDDGALRGVSDATPVGSDADHYARRPVGVFPWGQGPALLVLAREVQ